MTPGVTWVDYYLLRNLGSGVMLVAALPESERPRSLIVRQFQSLAEGLAYAALAGLDVRNAELRVTLTG